MLTKCVPSAALALMMTLSPAFAGLNCGPAQVYIGDPGSRSGRVVSTYVSINDGVWTVLHTLANGEVVDRSTQYLMRDTSNRSKTQWIGELNVARHLYMIGEAKRLNATGQPTYEEWLFDHDLGGALVMHSMALCQPDTSQEDSPSASNEGMPTY